MKSARNEQRVWVGMIEKAEFIGKGNELPHRFKWEFSRKFPVKFPENGGEFSQRG